MKNILKIVVITAMLVKDVFALFGGGGGTGIVSDPTSYTYYAKQIKAMNDEIKTALDQLEVLNKANDTLNKTNDLVFNAGERIYNPHKQIMGLVSNVEGIQRKFQRMADRASNMGAERFFKDYHNVNEPLKDDILKKWKDNFNALFDNKEDEKYQKLNEKVLDAVQKNNYTQYQKAIRDLDEYVKLKGIEQEALKKYALLAPLEVYNDYFVNEELVEERKERLERIKQLASQIQSEKDMVKQQQTTNQFLVEMLQVQQSQYELQMKFFYAVSMNLITEKSNTKYDLNKVIDERKNYRNSQDGVKSKTSESMKSYIDNLIKSPKGNSIDDILEGKI